MYWSGQIPIAPLCSDGLDTPSEALVDISEIVWNLMECRCFFELSSVGSFFKAVLALAHPSRSTGIPRLVRFFGPQQTALLEKPH